MKRGRGWLWVFLALIPTVVSCASCSRTEAEPTSDRPTELLVADSGGEPSAVEPSQARSVDREAVRPADGRSADLSEAAELHFAGVYGDDESAERALDLLVELDDESPGDAVIQAYLGSARILAAKRVLAPWKKGETCKAGLALVDGAIAAEPDNAELRFLRAISTYPLPGFFGRRRASEEELERLADDSEGLVRDGRLTAGMAAAALLHHGFVLRDRGDAAAAVAIFERTRAMAPGSEPALLATTEIEALTAR